MRGPLALLVTTLLGLLRPADSGAQYTLGRGRVLLGGQASYSRTSGESNGQDAPSRRDAVVASNVQYFVLDGFAVGLQANYMHANQGSISASTLGIGPGVSYYFGPAVTRVHPFVSASALITRGRASAPGVPSLSGSGGGYQVSAGVLFFLTRNSGLTASAFRQGSSISTGGVRSNSDVLGVALGVSAFAF